MLFLYRCQPDVSLQQPSYKFCLTVPIYIVNSQYIPTTLPTPDFSELRLISLRYIFFV